MFKSWKNENRNDCAIDLLLSSALCLPFALSSGLSCRIVRLIFRAFSLLTTNHLICSSTLDSSTAAAASLATYEGLVLSPKAERDAQMVYWIDILRPSIECLDVLQKLFILHPLTVAECLKRRESLHQKLDTFGHYKCGLIDAYHFDYYKSNISP